VWILPALLFFVWFASPVNCQPQVVLFGHQPFDLALKRIERATPAQEVDAPSVRLRFNARQLALRLFDLAPNLLLARDQRVTVHSAYSAEPLIAVIRRDTRVG
jgi:hypothetical protein